MSSIDHLVEVQCNDKQNKPIQKGPTSLPIAQDDRCEGQAHAVWGAQDTGERPCDRNGVEPATGEGSVSGTEPERVSGAVCPIGSGNGSGVRGTGARIVPSTHGGTLALLIKNAEYEQECLKRRIRRLKDELKEANTSLNRSLEAIEQLKSILKNWQRNVEISQDRHSDPGEILY